jgi:hypothetical protein
VLLISDPKDPIKVRAGTIGARARWGPARVLRLDTLDPVTRDIVRAILTARKNASEAATPPDRAA